MRFFIPNKGVERIVTRFLIFPVKIGEEVRWLERATIRQFCAEGWWVNTAFVDDKKEVII